MANLEKPSFSRANRFKYTFHVSTSVTLAFVLVLMVNYIASRHYVRVDLTTLQQHSLSPKTIQILEHLPHPIEIVSIRIRSQDPRILYITQFIQDVLKEFTSHTSQLTVTDLDYYNDNQKVEVLHQELKSAGFNGELSEFENTLVVRMQGKYRILTYGKMFNFERNKERPEFQGEGVLRAVIEELSSNHPRRVLFLEGHGELDIRSDLPQGLSLFREKLLQENILVKTYTLDLQSQSTSSIPLIQQAELVIIPAPQKMFSPQELQTLSLYLDSGGKLIVFFDAWEDSNLNSILEPRGIKARKDQLHYSRELYPTQLSIRRWFSSHPINQSLAQLSGLTVFMEGACSLSLETDREGYQIQSIAQSDPETFSVLSSLKNRPKEILERTGPFAVAGVSVHDQMKLIVFGDADFIKNGEQVGGYTQRLGLRDGANSDLALNAINWCLAQDYRLNVDSKPLDLRLIQLDVDTSQRIGFLLCILLPLASVAFYWIALDFLRLPWIARGVDILEDILRHPSSFFETSLASISTKSAIFISLGSLTFLGLLFYTFCTHLGFSFIAHSPSSPVSLKKTVNIIIQWENKANAFAHTFFLPELPSNAPKQFRPNLRTTFLIRSLQYFVIYGVLLLALPLLFGVWSLFWYGFFLGIIILIRPSSEKTSFAVTSKLFFLSLFSVQVFFPIAGAYCWVLLARGLQKGIFLSCLRSWGTVFFLVFCQYSLLAWCLFY